MRKATGRILFVLFVFCCLSTIRRVFSWDIQVGHFEIFDKHPKLQTCAASTLKTENIVGCRVSKKTGNCQVLGQTWVLNSTIENEYAYALKVYEQRSFGHSPREISTDGINWSYPMAFSTGVQIDISMSISNCCIEESTSIPVNDTIFSLFLYPSPRISVQPGEDFRLFMRAFTYKSGIVGTTVGWEEKRSNGWTCDAYENAPFPVSIHSMQIFKISLLAKSDKIMTFFDDEMLSTFSVSLQFGKIAHISLANINKKYSPISLHGISFARKH